MPEDLTPEEERQLEIDEAKHEVRRNLLILGGLIGREEARDWVSDLYPFTPF